MSWKLIDKTKKVLQAEEGAIIKPWGGKTTIALVYPNHYHIGMGNLGFQTIYTLLNRFPDVLCERVFLPGKDECQEFQRSKRALFSMESQTPLGEFEIIAFSISFENDYLNVLRVLELARIPLLTSKRKGSYPIIMAGGITTFLNPEPLTDFIDLFAIGEGEEIVSDFLEVYQESVQRGDRQEVTLAKFAQIEGIYVPHFYRVSYDTSGLIKSFQPRKNFPKKVKRVALREVDKYLTSSSILAAGAQFGDKFLIELSRGCGGGCRFCAVGFVCRPPRNRSYQKLKELVVAGLKKRDTIGLVGTMVTDYPWLSDLCETIFKNGGKFSPGSLRIDSLDEKLVGFLEKSGEKTISLAPEAGSERLRKVINKEITDEEILYIVELLIRGGILNLKLYFMIGLPTETGSDIEAIVGLGKKVRHLSLKLSQGKKRIERITLSINPFVPKPSTPFQWHPFEDIRSLKNKLKIIANGLKKEPNLYVTFESPKWSYIQALLSRGDRRVGKLLSMVHRLGGDWQKAFKKVNLNPDFYVYRPRDFDEILPWDFIDQGIKKDYLVSEYHRGLLGASTPKCDTRRCKTCGVC